MTHALMAWGLVCDALGGTPERRKQTFEKNVSRAFTQGTLKSTLFSVYLEGGVFELEMLVRLLRCAAVLCDACVDGVGACL